MNHLLAIDTSTSRASIALAKGDDIYHVEQTNIREHAQFVLPMIAQLLSQAEINLRDLEGIVLGRGPGSFTGLRIACSVVKGLAYPHHLPVYPVSSLAAIAEDVFYTEPEITDKRVVLTVIDARMHEVYWDCYHADGSHLEERVSPASMVQLPTDSPLILAGVGITSYFSALPAVIQQHCIKQQEVFPDARAMIRIVRAGRSTAVSAADALPVYVRNQVVQGG